MGARGHQLRLVLLALVVAVCWACAQRADAAEAERARSRGFRSFSRTLADASKIRARKQSTCPNNLAMYFGPKQGVNLELNSISVTVAGGTAAVEAYINPCSPALPSDLSQFTVAQIRDAGALVTLRTISGATFDSGSKKLSFKATAFDIVGRTDAPSSPISGVNVGAGAANQQPQPTVAHFFVGDAKGMIQDAMSPGVLIWGGGFEGGKPGTYSFAFKDEPGKNHYQLNVQKSTFTWISVFLSPNPITVGLRGMSELSFSPSDVNSDPDIATLKATDITVTWVAPGGAAPAAAGAAPAAPASPAPGP